MYRRLQSSITLSKALVARDTRTRITRDVLHCDLFSKNHHQCRPISLAFQQRRDLSTQSSSIAASSTGRRRKVKAKRDALKKRRQTERLKQLHQLAANLQLSRERSLDEFHNFVGKLTDQFTEPKIESTLDRIREACENDDLPLPVSLVALYQSAIAAGTPGMDAHVLSFLLNLPLKEKKRLSVSHKDIECIVKARRRALENELFWNQVDRKEVSDLPRSERQTILLKRTEILENSNPETEFKEAEAFAKQMNDRLPARYYLSLLTVLRNYVEPALTLDDYDEPSQGPGFAMRTLSSPIAQATSEHYSHVAQDIAKFFYTTIGRDDLSHIENDELFTKSHKTLRSLQDRMIEQFCEIHQSLLDSLEMSAENKTDSERMSEETEKELKLDQKPEIKIDGRFRKQVHVKFDASIMHEATQFDEFDHSDLAERMIFLENLPIDMKVSTLEGLYTRCGPIESIEILNQRPDLDPGALSMSKIAQLRQKQAQMRGYRQKRWRRPRTPVYGKIVFADKQGYTMATEASLRIFGMIIERHPVRSIPAIDLSTLFLENLPMQAPCEDVEYELTKTLHPDVFVSLRPGQNSRSLVGSCEIRFPSFHVAYSCYNRLRSIQLGEDTNIAVHWLRTPMEANQWWRRELGFY